MSTRRFDNFSARLEGRAADQDAPDEIPDVPTPTTPDDPAPDPDPEDTTDKEDEIMSDNTPLEEREDYRAGLAAGEEIGRKAATDRVHAVFASENFAGREAAAARYLQTDMTAEQITTVLGDLPKAQQVNQEQADAAAAEAARAEMRGALNTNNAELGADEEEPAAKTGRAAADARWDKANAAIGRVKKEG